MADLFKKALSLIVGNPAQTKDGRPLKKLSERELIRLESNIGRDLFGAIPAGHRREFFCLDPHTWIWYEEWIDPITKKASNLTTRYEVHPNGILKVQDGKPYHFIEGVELQNLSMATQLYRERVMRDVYRKDPHTGLPLSEVPDTIKGV
jgi:hypothetical protein